MHFPSAFALLSLLLPLTTANLLSARQEGSESCYVTEPDCATLIQAQTDCTPNEDTPEKEVLGCLCANSEGYWKAFNNCNACTNKSGESNFPEFNGEQWREYYCNDGPGPGEEEDSGEGEESPDASVTSDTSSPTSTPVDDDAETTPTSDADKTTTDLPASNTTAVNGPSNTTVPDSDSTDEEGDASRLAVAVAGYAGVVGLVFAGMFVL